MSNTFERLIAAVCLTGFTVLVVMVLSAPSQERPSADVATHELKLRFWDHVLIMDNPDVKRDLIQESVVVNAAIDEWMRTNYGAYMDYLEVGKDPRELPRTLVPWINLSRSTARISSLCRTVY